MRFLIALSLSLLTSCSSPRIGARTLYTSRRDLASYALDTPDPDKALLSRSQVIWIDWRCSAPRENVLLYVLVRFPDGFEYQQTFPIHRYYGSLMAEIPQHVRQGHGDLLCYRIELRRGDTVLATANHKLWVQKIEITDA